MQKISKFAIRGLYDERDIEIPFDSNIKILVAENGYGKTTVLNALYALVSGDIARLRKISCQKLEISLGDDSYYELSKDSLAFTSQTIEEQPFFFHLKRIIGKSQTDILLESFITLPRKQLERSHQFQNARRLTEMPASLLYQYLGELVKGIKDRINLSESQAIVKEIKEKLNFNILYLPTYRRVEQDFRDLRLSEEGDDLIQDNSINFGMSDVDRRIKEITQNIISSSVEWFSKVNGQMLSQLVEGFVVDESLKESIRDPDAIKIVLNRIGSNIGETQKASILQLVESGDILLNHDPLIYFISNLVKVYEQQKENDKSIQDFTDVCNRYLTDKKLEYDESSVSVKIVRRKNGNDVEIETLSSGEKQIISLFCSLYLKKTDDFAIFFDEPELSLSLEWQKTLLPDVIRSGKCEFLFATTHSPFIFENELVVNTVDLGNYIQEL